MPRGLSVTLVHPAVPVASPFERLGRSHLPPLGVLYLAASLEAAGHRVEVVDLNLSGSWAELEARLARRPPQVVGLGTLTPAFAALSASALRLRRALPASTLLVAGGPDVTVRRAAYQGLGCFDALLLGEAERTLVQLCGAYPDLLSGPGFLLPGQDSLSALAAPPVLPDEVPFPARHLLPLERYRGGPAYKRDRRTTSVFTHRGCPYQCTFCEKGVHHGPMRRRSPGSILEEVRRVRRDTGIQDIRFMDDVFLVNPAEVDELVELILRGGERFSWLCTARVDLLQARLLRRMRQAGCYRVELGVESGSPRILELINKRIQLSQVHQAIRLCREAGIESIANFILGFPSETEAEMERTVQFSLDLDPNWAVYFSYYPAAASEIVRHFDIMREGEDPASPRVRAHPAFLVSEPRVQALVNQAYTRFYFRPRTVVRRLAALRSPWVLADLASTAAAHLAERIRGAGAARGQS